MKPRAVSLKQLTEGKERLAKRAKQKDRELTSSQTHTKSQPPTEKTRTYQKKSTAKDIKRSYMRQVEGRNNPVLTTKMTTHRLEGNYAAEFSSGVSVLSPV